MSPTKRQEREESNSPGRALAARTRRRSTRLGRVASSLLLAAALAPSLARAQEPSFADIVRRSGFIFAGTVKALGAATPSIVPAPNSAVVRVDRVLETQPPAGNPTGHDVTVRLRDLQKSHVGDRAVFFTYVQTAGATLELIEVASLPADQAEEIERRIRETRQAFADQALAARLASAELVVVGVFGEARPTPDARDPRSEHDPLWWRAPIRVESVEKGQAPATRAATPTVSVNIATNYDFLWALAPKPKAGQEGIYLLQPDREKKFRVAGLFLLDPLDALPKSELERVRRLLKAPPPR